MKNISIKAKLSAGFGLMSLIVVAMSGFGLVSLSREHEDFSKYVEETGARIGLVHEILDAANARAIAARNLVLVSTEKDREVEQKKVTQAHLKVGQALAHLKEAINKPGVPASEVGQFKDLEAVEAKYGPLALGIVKLALEGNKEQATVKMNVECRPLLAALVNSAEAFERLGSTAAAAQAKDAESSFKTHRATLASMCVGAFLLAIYLATSLTRAITRPIEQAVAVARTVAAGDLTSHIEATSDDETGRLLASLKTMNDELVKIVGSVRQSSDSIATGSAQIATGNADLSHRTEEQASNLQRTAASMEQMNSTVKSSADTAQRAAQLAISASLSAQHGGEVVAQVVTTMGGITDSSKRIAAIISVIDGISFQTNILALNAAVEAARAGEQGRGFAVVASEVRGLAQRSASAAKEIAALIDDSVSKVDAGSRLVADAGMAMSQIVSQVKQVSDLIGEISATAVEQTSGIGHVTDAVAQLDDVTQQNAALVEQSAAAADSLRQQASRLAEVVSVFKVRA